MSEQGKYYINLKNNSSFDFYYFNNLKDLEVNFNALRSALLNKCDCAIEHTEGTTFIPFNLLQNTTIFFNAKIKIN